MDPYEVQRVVEEILGESWVAISVTGGEPEITIPYDSPGEIDHVYFDTLHDANFACYEGMEGGRDPKESLLYAASELLGEDQLKLQLFTSMVADTFGADDEGNTDACLQSLATIILSQVGLTPYSIGIALDPGSMVDSLDRELAKSVRYSIGISPPCEGSLPSLMDLLRAELNKVRKSILLAAQCL